MDDDTNDADDDDSCIVIVFVGLVVRMVGFILLTRH
jgi:hypothetical protein